MDKNKDSVRDREKRSKSYMKTWRRDNQAHLRQYNKIYRMKKKLCGGGGRDEK